MCPACSTPIDSDRRIDTVYCSVNCRMTAYHARKRGIALMHEGTDALDQGDTARWQAKTEEGTALLRRYPKVREMPRRGFIPIPDRGFIALPDDED